MKIVLLRGHEANVWDLRPWERLAGEHEVEVLVTGSNVHQVEGLGLTVTPIGSLRDRIPGSGRIQGALAYAAGERYLGLEEHLRGADIVHAAEIGRWFSAQAADLRDRLGFKLVLTVWETIPWRDVYRWPRERRYRAATLPRTDLFLPTTERAAAALRLEGVPADRVQVAPPGIDLSRFAPRDGERTRILSAGRLVWEKGHQDVLRAVAHTGRDDIDLWIVGSGPEETKLRTYAEQLGVRATFRSTIPYDEMPELYASSRALVLASLPTKGWEEQFGMVLVEAMACGTPIIAASSGAIPEVAGDAARYFSPGDWIGLARLLEEDPPSQRPDADRLARYSVQAAADRYAAAYSRLA